MNHDLLLLAAMVLAGLFAGGLSGVLGVGGGVVIVPGLVLLFGLDQHLAQGTSLAVIVPTALVGAVTLARRGQVDLRRASFVALGGLAGAGAGAIAALHISGPVLQRIFGAWLLLVAWQMILRRKPRRPASQEQT